METLLTEYGMIIPALIFMAVMFMGSAVITGTMAYRDVVKSRLHSSTVELGSDSFQDKRNQSAEFVSKIGGAFAGKDEDSSDLRKKLTAAGFSAPNAITVFIGLKMILLVISLGLAAIVYYVLDFPFSNKMLAIISLIAVGFFLPNYMMGFLSKRRAKQFRNYFPDAIDLLEICVSGGMGIDSAWNAVTENLRPICPMLADELSLTNLEMHLGSTRAQAMRNMADRTSSDDVASLVTSMVQSEKFGTSIGETLRVFALSLRAERTHKAEESAEKMAVKMLFPMVCFIFPVVIIVAVGPAAITMVQIFSE